MLGKCFLCVFLFVTLTLLEFAAHVLVPIQLLVIKLFNNLLFF